MKHLIIDPIQDTILKLYLDKLIKIISNNFGDASIQANLEPGIAHQFMHIIFAPLLKLLGLSSNCNHNSIKQVITSNDDDSLSSAYDDDIPLCGMIPTNLHRCNDNDCFTQHSPIQFSPLNQKTHIHKSESYLNKAIEEYVMHAAVKGVAVLLFPTIYLMKDIQICNQYKSFCTFGETTIKLLGINPLEGIYLLHKTAKQIAITNKTLEIIEPYFPNLNYNYLQEDKEAYQFLHSLDLYLEAVDGVMHGLDNLELVYQNRDLPGISLITAAIAIAGGTFYYVTEEYESAI